VIRGFGRVHKDKDKIQSVQWNDKEPTVLLSESYDRTVRTFNSRAPKSCLGAVVGSDVEALRWDSWDPYGFCASMENGLILNSNARTLPYDRGNPSPSRFTLSTHDGTASALDINPHARGVLVTGGTDKVVKVWNVTLVTSGDLGVARSSPQFHQFVTLTFFVKHRVTCSRPSGLRTATLPSRPEAARENSKPGTSAPTATSGRHRVLNSPNRERHSRKRWVQVLSVSVSEGGIDDMPLRVVL